MKNRIFMFLVLLLVIVGAEAPVFAAGEIDIVLPDLSRATFPVFAGANGHQLLSAGLIVAGLGLLFGLVIFQRLNRLPVHSSMKEISELIYETCKTYLQTQGRFLMILELFIGLENFSDLFVFFFGEGVFAFEVGRF